jgi:hypothetical protein
MDRRSGGARQRRNFAAVSTTPIFCATAIVILWLSDTPSSSSGQVRGQALARLAAATLMKAGSFGG